ncbi:MAG: alkaline phosphatase [Rikenellaceae bacterium]|nr:alkaline phosphatase [Rikenellaceae bacterium]
MRANNILAGILSIFLFLPLSLTAQEHKPVKNLILMIPDGTSSPVLTLSRWYQWYLLGGDERLAVDPYFCGMVKTHCSDSPIGDSAPTTSAFMTGYYTNSGYTGMYPTSFPDRDIYPIDTARRYQPLTTLPEAMRIMQNKSIGLVVTCEFPHATPANVATHSHNRSNYPLLMKQMAHNGLDVVFAGGAGLINDAEYQYLEQTGTTVVKNNINHFRQFEGDKLWALFGRQEMPYDLDRDTTMIPSIAEMTEKALGILSQNENGFFLMVEGSQVDWAAHANDPIGLVTEYLAFDHAVRKAIDFAKEDGETLVIIVPDHGNSGISIGNHRISSGYDKLPLEKLMSPFRDFKVTSQEIVDMLEASKEADAKELFKEYLGIDLTDEEVDLLNNAYDYNNSPLPKEKRKGKRLQYRIGELMAARTLIGFTTTGHTGEDVFLAAYHPYGRTPGGLFSSEELNAYMQKEVGLGIILDSLTNELYVPHHKIFPDAKTEIDMKGEILKVSSGKNKLTVYGNTNLIEINGTEHYLPSITVFVEPNKTFYVPAYLRDFKIE